MFLSFLGMSIRLTVEGVRGDLIGVLAARGVVIPLSGRIERVSGDLTGVLAARGR